jgi:NAD(P)H dehydrogenase (quinone)
MIVVTGATGHLGHHVIAELLRKVPANRIVAAARSPSKASDYAALGIEVREADYNKPETLDRAFVGAEKVLLVSSSEVGQRVAHHRNVIEAATRAGVDLLVYTSILRADRSRLLLAQEHRETEDLIRASWLPFVLLRNGWYTENYTEALGSALQTGVIVGCSGSGRVATAARADFAAAAVAALTSWEHENRVYELAGDNPFTMAELAAEVSRQSGRPVVYKDLSPEEYAKVLEEAGVPKPAADLYVDSSLGIARGDLMGSSEDLRRLIGRPTTTLAESVRAALSGAAVSAVEAGAPAT